MPEFSKKNCLLSGKNTLKRSKLFIALSTSACAKSVLKVRSITLLGEIAHFISPPILVLFVLFISELPLFSLS